MIKLNKTIVFLGVCILFAGQRNIVHTAEVQLECLFLQQFKNESIARVDISYDGKHLLAGSTVEKIRYWNIKKIESSIEASFESELIALNFITKDNHIFFANRIGTTRIFTNRFSKKLTEYRFPKTSQFSRIGNNADLIAYGENIYYPAQDRLLSSTVGHAAQSALQVGRQKYVLTSGFHDERVGVRDPDGNIRSSALSKNNWLSIGLDNGNVQRWDILQGKLLSAVTPSKKRITSIDINQATKLLLVGSYDGIVALYKIEKEYFTSIIWLFSISCERSRQLSCHIGGIAYV